MLYLYNLDVIKYKVSVTIYWYYLLFFTLNGSEKNWLKKISRSGLYGFTMAFYGSDFTHDDNEEKKLSKEEIEIIAAV